MDCARGQPLTWRRRASIPTHGRRLRWRSHSFAGRNLEKREYITDEGYRRLREELDQLFRVERPRVVKGVADAAAEGDRSENAEYIYGKKKLREIDKRIEFLTKRVDVLTVVTEYPPQGTPQDLLRCLGGSVRRRRQAAALSHRGRRRERRPARATSASSHPWRAR